MLMNVKIGVKQNAHGMADSGLKGCNETSETTMPRQELEVKTGQPYHYHASNLLPVACLSTPPRTITATQPNRAIKKRINHAASAVAPKPVLSCIARARSIAGATVPVRASGRPCSSEATMAQAGCEFRSTGASSSSWIVRLGGEDGGDGGRGTSQGSLDIDPSTTTSGSPATIITSSSLITSAPTGG